MSKRDQEDGLFDDDDDDEDESSDEEPSHEPPKKRKKLDKSSMIDDAAEESGDEGDEEDEDEEDEDNNDYIKDGFVVDEEEEIKKKKDDLEDSDEEGSEDEEDKGSESDEEKTPKRLKKLSKMKQRLDEEDLALIQEAQADKVERPERGPEPAERQRVVAKTEAELRKGLFYDSGDEEQQPQQAQQRQTRVERYDEDGMDDFIDDDIGDQGAILASERRDMYDEDTREVSEAQLNEASEIFGTDYLEFMAAEQRDEDEEELLGKYHERGVGVDLGVYSDEEMSEEDEDDDLFGESDEDMDSSTADQKAEALKLKRQKRKLVQAERRRQSLLKKAERRKAQLRRAFEPVQLVENFCTDRDDDIRQTDAPERMYDWKTPFHGSDKEGMTDEEKIEAMWIVGRVPDIAAEFQSFAGQEDRQTAILQAIANALRYMHRDKLEPAFIKRYRKDYVTSPAVRDNLYAIMDEDSGWDRVLGAREKVDNVLQTITAAAELDASAGEDVLNVRQLQEALQEAQDQLDETAKQESNVKAELGALGDEEDDDDELFGDDDDDDNDEEKKSEKSRLTSHLSTIQSLLEARAEKVSQLQSQLQVAEANNQALNDIKTLERVTKNISREKLWNNKDYLQFLSGLTDVRHILDMNGYLNLIKEGNDAVRKKEMPMIDAKDGKSSDRKRSRRFDRDFYRTCVSEGLRAVCYRFLLAPNRVGIKLEDTVTSGGFDFMKTMPGEENIEGSGDPLKWVPPMIASSPTEFANELIGSGELVLLSNSATESDENGTEPRLRGCRYVAAMELAHEPRVRMYLRKIYRRHVLLTTRPTKKGMDTIDAFHDYYGLHLIRGKPVKEHFPTNGEEVEARISHLSSAEQNEFYQEMKKKEKESCLQYLNILKAEQTGDISVLIHLPFNEDHDDWYRMDAEQLLDRRKSQDLSAFVSDTAEFKRVYFGPDGDTTEWNNERLEVLHLALVNFLLPQFEAELRRDLREAAFKAGVRVAADNLKTIAMEGPYRPQALVHSENRFLYPTGDLPLVGVCCSSDGKDAMYLASVTERGESNDYLPIPSGMRIDSDKMREKVIMFLLQSRPAAVVVGTSGGFESRLMARKLGDLIVEAVQQWKNRDIQADDEDDETFEARSAAMRQLLPPGHYDDDDEIEWTCNVELVDDSVPQLFGRSVRGKKEFPDFPVNLKCAISTARYAKDPLGELTYTWSVASDAGVFGTEMLYLNIHPLQQLLPKTLLLREYERTLCDVVADVGTDVNAACSFDHLRGLLMFVPGLGPRKATNMKQSVAQLGGAIARRRDILAKQLVGPIVYNNAIAFLRIREADQLADQFLNPLDDTRLHPDVYIRNKWAVKIAFDALEREDKVSDSASIKALHDVMDNSHAEVERLYKATKAEWEQHYGPTFNTKDWDPRINVPNDMWRDKVEELDLEAFANMIQDNGLGKWNSQLEMIKWEFRLPFADPRKPMEPLTGDKLFQLITGETDQSLRPGREIAGKVVRNGDFGSRVKLEGDIPAFIPLRNLADEHVESAEDIVPTGAVVTAIITEVKKDHMTVDMSLRMEDFRKKPSSWERPQSLPPIDDRFDRVSAARLEEEKEKSREARLEALQLSLKARSEGEEGTETGKKRTGLVVRRACTHPAFRNSKNDEVNKELEEAGPAMVGEALIRPSNKNSDALAVHWAVKEGSIKVIEVLEEDKETDASIGNVLKIKGETYGSIDELLGRYIAPMNDYVEELVNHRKFLDLTEDEVDEKLKEQKKANPKSIPYAVCWMEMHPGYASLRFVSTATPRSHPIGITPNGFSWGANTFPSLEILINKFKVNPRGVAAKPETKAAPKPPPAKPAVAKTRWGEKPAPPAQPAPPGWGQPAPPAIPPVPPVAQGGWGAPSASTGVWGQAPPPPVPRPTNIPPPQAYGQASQQRPPPPGPPPAYGAPPPQGPPPPGPPPPFGQPPAAGPPAFDFGSSGASGQGRGRGRTLPAWMQKS